MKITIHEKNIIRIKTDLGSIAVQDGTDEKTKNQIIVIAVNVPFGTKIKGIGTRLTVLQKEDT